MAIFDTCRVNASFDEMLDENCEIREHWQGIAKALKKTGIKKLEQKQVEIDWRLEDNGVTYNVYNDPDGTNRKWNLDPIPFVLQEKEWDQVSKGLQQRAKLLDLIYKDIYTDQKLISDGIIPAEIIYSHKGFIPEAAKFRNKDYYNLLFYAADISRGPDGKFWLINDRTSAPSGLGYAIENRLTMNSISAELYPNIEMKKLISFIDGFKKALKKSTTISESPLIVLLTPGPHNETYFEHSYLSAFLDLTLVQGEDLLARDNHIWLKNLNGLKRVDGILRRIDDRYCDPLELKNDSRLGVTGLLNVARNNNISIINPIGIGILENSGLNPFMKNICKYFLDEELILPQIATWWCGQEHELEYVLEHIPELIIKKIDKTEKLETYIGNNLKPEDIEKLKHKIKQFPQAYVGQEHITFSTTPSFTGKDIEPRNALIRAFSYKEGDHYEVMKGGLVRVATSKDSLIFTGQSRGNSKDLWILGVDEKAPVNPLSTRAYIDTKLENISTKRAENLFWLGRYITRAIISSRMIRFNLKHMMNIYKYDGCEKGSTITQILNIATTHLTMTYPGFLDPKKEIDHLAEMIDIIKNQNRVGSLSFTINMLSNSNINVKNLLTIDAWRIFDRLNKSWYHYVTQKEQPVREHINQINNLLIYLMSYKELIDESIFKEQGLILFDIGGKIESSLLLISKLRSLLSVKVEKMLEYEVLDGLLNSHESYNSYRAYYQSSLDLANVVEFLIFNPKYPKSLIYILSELLQNLKELPRQKNNDYLSSSEEPIFKAYSKIKLSSPQELLDVEEKAFMYEKLDQFLSETSMYLINASDALTQTYFSHNND